MQRRKKVEPGITLWELINHYKKEELDDVAKTLMASKLEKKRSGRKIIPPRQSRGAIKLREDKFKELLWKKVNEDSNDLESLRGRPRNDNIGILYYCGRRFTTAKQCQCGKGCNWICGPEGTGGCQCPECIRSRVTVRLSRVSLAPYQCAALTVGCLNFLRTRYLLGGEEGPSKHRKM